MQGITQNAACYKGPLAVVRAVFLLCLLFCVAAASASPHISYIFPAGGRAGTRVRVNCYGTELKAVTGVLAFNSGLTGTVAAGGDDTHRVLSITIPVSVPLGIKELRLYGSAGVTNVRYFAVGDLPEVTEQEPNDTPAEANTITAPITVNGKIEKYGDMDCFSFRAAPGQEIVCRVQAMRLLGEVDESWLKGYMEVHDPAGAVLASSDGEPDNYYRWDPVIVFTPKATGTYTVTYRDLNWRGAANAVYRLSIGAVPHLFALYPQGIQAGLPAMIHLDGVNLPAATVSLAAESARSPESRIQAGGPGGNSRAVMVDDFNHALQTESSRLITGMQQVKYPCTVDGRVAVAGETDTYRVHVGTKQRLVFETYAWRLGTPLDTELSIYTLAGRRIDSNDDMNSPGPEPQRDSRIEREMDKGDYLVRVRDNEGRGGARYTYELQIHPPQPAYTLTVSPDSGTVKQGGTLDLQVRVVRREGFDGPITLSVAGLPTGITAKSATIDKGKDVGTVTLAASVPLAGAPVTVIVHGTAAGAPDATATAVETYNIQGTAFTRAVIGPIMMVTAK